MNEEISSELIEQLRAARPDSTAPVMPTMDQKPVYGYTGPDSVGLSGEGGPVQTTESKPLPPLDTEPFIEEAMPGDDNIETSLLGHPFKIETRINPDTEVAQYRVLDYGSSIIDGTNGALRTITGLADSTDAGDGWAAADEKLVIVEVLLDSDLEITKAEIKLIALAEFDLGEFEEVIFNTDFPPIQSKALLLIGKLVPNEDGGYDPHQSIMSAQRLTYGLLNGSAVKVFESAPSHPDSLQ
jgi:hypothetical protein